MDTRSWRDRKSFAIITACRFSLRSHSQSAPAFPPHPGAHAAAELEEEADLPVDKEISGPPIERADAAE